MCIVSMVIRCVMPLILFWDGTSIPLTLDTGHLFWLEVPLLDLEDMQPIGQEITSEIGHSSTILSLVSWTLTCLEFNRQALMYVDSLAMDLSIRTYVQDGFNWQHFIHFLEFIMKRMQIHPNHTVWQIATKREPLHQCITDISMWGWYTPACMKLQCGELHALTLSSSTTLKMTRLSKILNILSLWVMPLKYLQFSNLAC